MKRCEKCGVQFSGDLDRCPLCQAELSGDASPAVFPRNEVRKSGAIALAVLAFATGACLLVMLFLGHLLQLPGDIVVTVCVGLVVNYLFVRNILTHTPDFLRVVARYFLVLLAIAAIWFLVSRNPVVTTFAWWRSCSTACCWRCSAARSSRATRSTCCSTWGWASSRWRCRRWGSLRGTSPRS